MLVIFDWDGTLIDSAAKIVTCMQRAAEQLGIEPLPDEPIRQIIGLSLPQAIAVLYPNESSAVHEAMRQQYVSYYIGMDQTPTPLFAGVTETLHTLRDAGYTDNLHGDKVFRTFKGKTIFIARRGTEA